MGELSRELEKAEAGRPSHNTSHQREELPTKAKALRDAGISSSTAHRYEELTGGKVGIPTSGKPTACCGIGTKPNVRRYYGSGPDRRAERGGARDQTPRVGRGYQQQQAVTRLLCSLAVAGRVSLYDLAVLRGIQAKSGFNDARCPSLTTPTHVVG
jgi:hypothetical protein